MSGPFRGTWALVHSRRRAVVFAPLAAGLVGFALAALLRLSDAAPEHDAQVLTITAVLLALLGPGLASVGLTSFSPFDARRQALLLLPTGRLALPAAVEAVSAWVVVAGGSAMLVGWAVARPGLAVLTEQGPGVTAAEVAICLCGAAAMTSVFVLRLGAVFVALLSWALAMAVTLVLSVATGLDDASLARDVLRWGVCLGLVWVAAPMALLRRGPVALVEPDARDPAATADGALLVGTALAALVFVVHGAGAALGVLGVAGVAATWRARLAPPGRRAPPRPGRALLALLVLGVAPPLVSFAVADARRGAALDRGLGVVREVALSPDGRQAAVVLGPRVGNGNCLRRVVVVDLEGGAPPVVLPARAPVLPPGAWSADGRLLAVADLAVGRLGLPYLLAVEPRFLADGERAWIDAWLRFALRGSCETIVFDSATRGVERLDLRVVAPGWREPGELVRVTLDGDGRGDRLVDDRRGLAVDLALGVPEIGAGVLGYDEGVLALGSGFVGDGHALAVALVPGRGAARWRFGPAGFERLDAGWLVVREQTAKGLGPVCALRRGERRVALRASAVWPDPVGGEDSVLVADEAGLGRVRLADGARATLRAGLTPRRQDLVLPSRGEVALVRERGSWEWLDLRDGATRPAPGVTREPGFVGPGRVVMDLRDGDEVVGFAVVGPDGARRELRRPWQVESP